ncbi:MAG TPA: exodeoxyribonuclease III [Pyrinomonadaceae bacterium]
MKVATWNVNSIKSRLDHVIKWCETNQPDILCLQETKVTDEKFPTRKLAGIGYPHVGVLGERGYNGVAIISKQPLTDVQKNLPGEKKPAQSRLIGATIGGLHLINVYAPHGTKRGTERYDFKLKYFERLRRYLDKNFDRDDDLILCGDLNVAPHELDVWKVSVWRDKLHFTKAERDALQSVKKWGLIDLFRQINGDVKEFTWWDQYFNAFERDRGLRIDQIWASAPLAERCLDCWIDRDPRGWEHPSDHAPVVAEFM